MFLPRSIFALRHWVGFGKPGLGPRRSTKRQECLTRRRRLQLEILEDRTLLSTWVEQGPGPVLNGQVQNIRPNNPVSGAINAIVADPVNPDIAYVGTVNGGIWRTLNATASSPTWTPLTDPFPSLSISALAVSPVDPATLYAGTGSFSNGLYVGGPSVGVYKTTDGGNNWTVSGQGVFNGLRIVRLVPTALDGGQVVLAATKDNAPGRDGVYRSTDGAANWTRISGRGGLPSGGVSDLVSDPADPNSYYAALPSQGIFHSGDGGATWGEVNTGIPGLRSASRIELAIPNSPGNNVVYAALMNSRLTGVFLSTNYASPWTAMGVPSPTINPGRQAVENFAIVADPTNPNVVFISGDRQDGPFPNANGSLNYTGNTFRGDTSLLPANPWASMDGLGANGTSPHADARAMVFDANDNLLESSDGGLYRLLNPDSADRMWVSAMGNLRPTEFYSVAYDSLNHTILGGAQDTGATEQVAAGDFTWREINQGDGAFVATDTTTAPGFVLHYASSQNLIGFLRRKLNTANTVVATALIQLRIVSGAGAGSTLFLVGGLQSVQPWELNRVNPARMLIGTTRIYESLTQGDTLNELGVVMPAITSLAYGGRLGGFDNPDVFYVAGRTTISHRETSGGPITTLTTYPGANVRKIAINPEDWRRVYVVDSSSRVWASSDAGASWTNLTGNLNTLSNDVRTLEIFNPTSSPADDIVLAGGLGGVFVKRGGNWTKLDDGMPNVLVSDLHYDAKDDVLLAGTYGRGALTLAHFRSTQSAATHFSVTPSANPVPAGSPFQITVTALDDQNNPIPGYAGTVHFVSTDNGATLPGDYTFTGADAGVHPFTVSLVQAGSQTITVTDTVSGITGTVAVAVTAASPDHVLVIAPDTVVSGMAFDVTVTVQDAFNNTVTTYLGTVRFTSTDNDPGVILPPDYSFTSNDAGVHNFAGGVTLVTPGSQTITVSDPSGGILGAAIVDVIAAGPPPAGGGGGNAPPPNLMGILNPLPLSPRLLAILSPVAPRTASPALPPSGPEATIVASLFAISQLEERTVVRPIHAIMGSARADEWEAVFRLTDY